MNRFMAALLGTALAAFVGTAQAATVAATLFIGNQHLSDNSGEILINAAGETNIVDVGDTLFGVFNIQTDEQTGQTTRNFGVGGVDEFSGIFEITVIGKQTFNGTTCLTAFCFQFGPSTAAIPVPLASGATGSLQSIFGAGTMIATWDDPTPDYVRIGATLTLAQSVASATDGSLFATLGATFWNANTITDNIALIGSFFDPANGGTFNEALNFLINNSGLAFSSVSCTNVQTLATVNVNVCGSGSLLGTNGSATPFGSFNNVDFRLNVVPEPAMLSLIGIGLFALGWMRRKAS
jgi:hypothetical protein